jgi:hypothetical protein
VISDWFFQWYLWPDAPAVMARLGFGVAILAFVIVLVRGFIDGEPDKWLDSIGVGVATWVILFVGGLIVPGMVGVLFWLFFL